MSFNTFLLTLCVKNMRFGSDVQSISKRYQVLAIIYVNICLIGIISGHELIVWMTLDTKDGHVLTSVMAPFISLSFWFLRRGKSDTAATVVLCYMHFVNFSAGHFTGQPMVALYALMLFPNFAFFLTPSFHVRVLNSVLCGFQFIHHILKIQEIFTITMSEEQSTQIVMLYIAAFVCLAFLCVSCFIQKSVEIGLWDMAHASYEKSENLTKEVLQAAEAKDAFVSSLSHEIRNPLNALNGSIDYLLSVVKDPNFLHVLKSAKLSAEILLNLANNVLDAAKLKSEKMDISYTRGNFVDIIKKVFTINSETLKVKNILAEAFIDRCLPQTLWIDPSRLLQIVMNLVSNALKFTPPGGKIQIHVKWCTGDYNKDSLLVPNDGNKFDRHVNEARRRTTRLGSNLEPTLDTRTSSILLDRLDFEEFSREELAAKIRNQRKTKDFKTKELRDMVNLNEDFALQNPWIIHEIGRPDQQNQNVSQEGFLKVDVIDSGCGIPEASIPKLFEMFVQAHQSVTNMRGGTGLGLWICKQLCQKMRGDIKLYSQVDQGTTFVFYIPVDNNLQHEPAVSRANPLRDDVNVLVADDYAHNRDLHKLLLQREGAHVTLAADGREAVRKFQDKEEGFFDFIMMDVLMPEVDGFMAAKMIRQWETEQERAKRVDIYFVSGEYFNEEEVLAAFKKVGGGSDSSGIRCLKKPVDVDMIKQVVQLYKAQSPAVHLETRFNK